MKKRKLFVTTLGVLAFVIVLSLTVLAGNPKWHFLLNEKIASVFQSADVSAVTPEYEAYTLEELSALENVTVNNTLMLVNSNYLIGDSFEAKIISYNGAEMSQETLDAYKEISEAITENFDTKLYVISSFRTPEDQQEIFDSSANQVAAVVGASEHQTGFALDVYVSGYSGMNLLNCPAGQYINSDCWRYGFIIRYPSGKTDITGIVFEPWHIRYVGEPHAKIMYLESLTLEEYINEYLTPGEFILFENAYISKQALNEHGKLLIPTGTKSVTVSPDNTGYYIVTAYIE